MEGKKLFHIRRWVSVLKCYETIMFGRVTYARRHIEIEREYTFVSILLSFIYTRVICYDYIALKVHKTLYVQHLNLHDSHLLQN